MRRMARLKRALPSDSGAVAAVLSDARSGAPLVSEREPLDDQVNFARLLGNDEVREIPRTVAATGWQGCGG